MGKGARARSAFDECAVQELADDLLIESKSPKIILKRLRALATGLEPEATRAYLALAFLRAGGLPTLVYHLISPTNDADINGKAHLKSLHLFIF
jgi:hypothetical protein